MSRLLDPYELVKDVQDNIKTSSLTKMLEHYGFGFKRNGGGGPYTIFTHTKYSDLRAHVSNFDHADDAGHVRMAANACIEADKRDNPKTIAAVRELSWLNLREDYASFITEDTLVIFRKDYPELQMLFGINGKEHKKPAGFDERFHNFVTLEMEGHIQTVTRLESDYGFSFERENGKFTVKHPATEALTYPYNSMEHIHREIKVLEDQVEEIWMQQRQKIQTEFADKHGFIFADINGTANPAEPVDEAGFRVQRSILITHPKYPDFELRVRAYGNLCFYDAKAMMLITSKTDPLIKRIDVARRSEEFQRKKESALDLISEPIVPRSAAAAAPAVVAAVAVTISGSQAGATASVAPAPAILEKRIAPPASLELKPASISPAPLLPQSARAESIIAPVITSNATATGGITRPPIRDAAPQNLSQPQLPGKTMATATEIQMDAFSFGVMVNSKRRMLHWSEQQLADNVNDWLASNLPIQVKKDDVTAEIVAKWEKALALPDQDYYNALEQVLITNNNKIPAEEKDARKAEFRKLYGDVVGIFSSLRLPTPQESRNFRGFIEDRMGELDIYGDSAKLAELVNKALPKPVTYHPLVEEHIADIELTVRLEEKPADLYYQGLVNTLYPDNGQTAVNFRRAWDNLPQKPRAYIDAIIANGPKIEIPKPIERPIDIDPRTALRSLRGQILGCFTKEGNVQLDQDSISRICKVNINLVGRHMGLRNNMPEKIEDAELAAYKDGLIRLPNKGPEVISRFESIVRDYNAKYDEVARKFPVGERMPI